MDLKNLNGHLFVHEYVIFALFTHIFDISKTDKILQFLANSPENFSRIFVATGSHVWERNREKRQFYYRFAML